VGSQANGEKRGEAQIGHRWKDKTQALSHKELTLKGIPKKGGGGMRKQTKKLTGDSISSGGGEGKSILYTA